MKTTHKTSRLEKFTETTLIYLGIYHVLELLRPIPDHWEPDVMYTFAFCGWIFCNLSLFVFFLIHIYYILFTNFFEK